MNKTARLAFLGVMAVATATSAMATWYTNEADFLAAIDPVFYVEDFPNFTYGDPLAGDPSWTAPGANGYGWDASASGGLYSGYSAISTNQAEDPLIITITSSPAGVTAIGGWFANTDINGFVITGDVTVSLDNGEMMTVTDQNGTSDFLGWVGSDVISTWNAVSSDPIGGQTSWVQIDHLYSGQAVPEPGTIIALGVGLAALAARRRRP
ncbi:MAG: PEP-CTERM sorting domain-containing protein [Fimbriimonadales bacterium]